MSDGFQFYDIIFFALIAIFIILRLRGVLGRRTGHQRQRHPDRFAEAEKQGEENQGEVVHLPERRWPEREPAEGGAASSAAAGGPRPADPSPAPEEDEAAVRLRAALEQIGEADRDFAPRRFLEGAQAAFEMVVEAFAKGETPVLRPLLGDDVYDEFAAAIRDRMEAGHTRETTIVALDKVEILGAELRGSAARVTVKFVSQQVNVTRDKEGGTVDGDPSLIERITDIWTFARNTRSSDPNWALVETSIPN